MFDSIEAPVIRLRRVGFGTVRLEDLPKRGVRELSRKEVESLLDLAVESKKLSNPPIPWKKPEIETRNDRRLAFIANRPARPEGSVERRATFDSGDSRRSGSKSKRRQGARRGGSSAMRGRSGGSGGKSSASRSGRR